MVCELLDKDETGECGKRSSFRNIKLSKSELYWAKHSYFKVQKLQDGVSGDTNGQQKFVLDAIAEGDPKVGGALVDDMA